MKTCCLVWEIPVIEGEHYNPIINVIYMCFGPFSMYL